MSERAPRPAADVLTAAQLAIVDAATAEAAAALRRAGVRCILLKGPVLTSWLYADGRPRPYGDTDLLVSPTDQARAAAALQELGYAPTLTGEELPPGHDAYADTWTRRDPPTAIDLHVTLGGARAPADRAWGLLSRDTERLEVGGAEVETLGAAGRALHVALHAGHHGARSGKPVDDLARALERADEATWRAAARLAGELDAVDAFAGGLRILPAGAALAGAIGLPAARSVEAELKAATAPPLAVGLERLARAPGARAKASLLGRLLVPSPAWVRSTYPVARRGGAGLLWAYVLRLTRIARYGPQAVRAWRGARRAVTRG
jgi:hypothetical protein